LSFKRLLRLLPRSFGFCRHFGRFFGMRHSGRPDVCCGRCVGTARCRRLRSDFAKRQGSHCDNDAGLRGHVFGSAGQRVG
jgi:hypothetical protein